MKKKIKGFTLIEVLIVMAILMSLVGIVGVNVISAQKKAKVKTARIQLKQLASAVQLYYADHSDFPTTAQGLDALVNRPVAPPVPDNYPSGGYLDSTRVPLDPWKNEYIYLSPGRAGLVFEIVSYGSDGEPGGTDTAKDLSSNDL